MANEEYPKRDEKHITETDSYTILRNILPHGWMLRELSEEDYGIDGIIEICDDGAVKGKVFAVQLKGHKHLSKTVANVKYYNVKSSTMNYWNNYPIPVIFLHISVDDGTVYYDDVKDTIRKKYESFLKKELTTIEIPQQKQLTKSNSEKILNMLYFIETDRIAFENYIQTFIINYENIIEQFNQEYQMDFGYGPERNSMELMNLINNHKCINHLAQYFDIDSTDNLNKSLFEAFEKSNEAIPDYSHRDSDLFCPFIDKYIREAEMIMKQLKENIEELILESDESYYWEKEKTTMYRYLLESTWRSQTLSYII